MTEFTQVYLRPKNFLLGSSLAFSLKEDPVRCAKVCDESWVILWVNATRFNQTTPIKTHVYFNLEVYLEPDRNSSLLLLCKMGQRMHPMTLPNWVKLLP